MAKDKKSQQPIPQTTPNLGVDTGSTVTIDSDHTFVPPNPSYVTTGRKPAYVVVDRNVVLTNDNYDVEIKTRDPNKQMDPHSVDIVGNGNRVANGDNVGSSYSAYGGDNGSVVTIQGNYNEYLGANSQYDESYSDAVDNVTVRGEHNRVFTRSGRDTIDATQARSGVFNTGSGGDTMIVNAKNAALPLQGAQMRVDMGRDTIENDQDNLIITNAGDGVPVLADYSVKWNKEKTGFDLLNSAGGVIGHFEGVNTITMYAAGMGESYASQKPEHDEISLTPGVNVTFDFTGDKIKTR